MKKYLSLIITVFALNCSIVNAQTEPGPAQQKMLDSICACMSKIDISKIKTAKEANDVFMQCFTAHADLLPDLAKEQNAEFTDDAAMNRIGTEIGANLLKRNCSSFVKLAMLMGKKDEDATATVVEQVTSGTFKRIDNKGFNYIVLTDNAGNEKSFIWLRQFPGSENFMNGTTKYVGKKASIKWQEIEVYLPQAKGYYKVKEILSVDIL